MLDQVLRLFGIEPDYDLNVMKPGQGLTEITAAVLAGLKPVLEEFAPDLLLVHGDTTTTLSASLAAYYQRIPVGHVEAGLRTGNIYSPWPEEINRKGDRAIARLCISHRRKKPPRTEIRGVSLQTGYRLPEIRSSTHCLRWLKGSRTIPAKLGLRHGIQDRPDQATDPVTGHRRESFGGGLRANLLRDLQPSRSGKMSRSFIRCT